MPSYADPSPPTSYVVLGAGGHAMSVEDVIASIGCEVAVFAGDAGDALPGRLLVADDDSALALAAAESHRVVVAIGENRLRRTVLARVDADLIAEAVIASTATVAATAQVGAGSVVHHHAHVGPRTRVGAAVIVNTAAVVEHDCEIADGAHIAPSATILGGATVGIEALVGSGARVLPGVRIGDRAVVGAGSVVVVDVPAGVTVAGVPAVRLGEPRG